MISGIELYHFEPDDDGNGCAFSACYMDTFLYVHERGWMYYTGTHWEIDKGSLRARKAAYKLLRARRTALEKHLGRNNPITERSENMKAATEASNSRANGCLSNAQVYINEDISAFDADPDVVNVKNGVLNLKTLTLIPHNFLTQRFTYCCPADWNPNADVSAWMTFIGQVVATNVDDAVKRQEILHFLQLWAGYSITGHTNEELAVYLYGPQRSGKGTTMETLQAIFPRPLSASMEMATLAQKREPGTQNFDLAPLQPCRLIFASEGNRQHKIDAAKLKHMTGGDEITCAFKFKDQFSYRPQYKLWLASNWPIHVDPDDHAAWGRFALLEYPTSFKGHENKQLKRILKRPKNLEGVLRWCVVGAQEWYSLEKGLVIPILLQLKLKKQQNDLDYLGQWIEDCCEEDTGAFTKHEDLYPSYLNWCKTNGVEPRAKIAFSQGLTSKGFINCRQSVGGKRSRGFSGLKLTAEELQSPANHRASMGMAIDELTTELVDAEDITIPPIQQQNGHEHIKMKAGRRTN